MCNCADNKKERHPLKPVALSLSTKDLPTPLQRMHGYRCRRMERVSIYWTSLYDGLHTGIKNARCGTIGQNSLSFVDMFKT